ncbi:MAG: hypothetical protein IKI05_07480, partial [Bacteroidaceae bacterium]|nr:hypothetical protein [Bacteroidaceae bacterium]
MRKITSLFALLLLCTVTATATPQTSVYLANTAGGSLPTAAGFGTFSGQTFTTATGSGLAGVTLTASNGLTIGEATVNVANYGYCFRFVTAAAATDYTVTLTAPDGYVITGYSLACSANTSGAPHTLTSEDGSVSVVASAPPYNSPVGPKDFTVSGLNAQTTSFTINTANKANTLYVPTFIVYVTNPTASYVDVTYELYESDGTTLVSSSTVTQEANSAVAVPNTLTSSSYFDYTVSGTIGDTDCTITVVRTLKAGIIGDLANLSNNKAYLLTTSRGSLGTNGTQMVSTNGTSYTASNFAIINYESNYYLYSVADSKFVGNPTTISGVQNQPILTDDLSAVSAISITSTTTPLFFIGYNGNGVNVSNYATGIVVNSWTTLDEGNQYTIVEAADFDATNALAALESYFHPTGETVFNAAIAQLESYPYGTGLNQYSLVVEGHNYTSQAADIISGMKTQGYTAENLTNAQLMLSGTSLNMPAAPMFLRLRSVNGANAYLKANNAGTRMTVTTTADESTIFCYTSDGKLVAYSNGIAINNVREIGTIGGAANSFTFIEGVNGSLGTYSVTAPYNSNTSYLYSTGVDGSNADRNTYSASFLNQNTWTLEEVTELPFTISAAGQATLSLPTAWEVPAGVTVRYASVEHDGLLTVEDATAKAIAADEAVILVGTPGDYTITLAASGETLGSILTSTNNGGVSVPAETKAYILALNGENQVVFSLLNDSDRNIAGFKAYYISTAAGEAP